jgi:UDP-N-acetyl-2-amino-2-deoxyglucuronate dehydrogenase
MLIKTQPIINRKIKFALIGCGRIAQKHITALQQFPNDSELVAICDINSDNLNSVAKLIPKIAIYNKLDDMLANGGFDVVIIASPSGLHATHTIQCAKAGFNVITEKPMATKWDDGLKMVKACDKAGVLLFVVKQNRYNATIQLLKQAITQGRFGRIYNVACNVFWHRPQEYYDKDKWRGTWEFDGGAFMNQASHYVDLLDWLIGPVESVQSYIATLARNIDVEDSGVLAIKWRSGAIGTMNVSMLTYPQNLEGSITIIGEKGTVRIGGLAVNQILIWEFADKLDNLDIINKVNYETTSVYGFGHNIYYENVIKILRGNNNIEYTDGREGLRSLEFLIAIYLSARDGRKISLPLYY